MFIMKSFGTVVGCSGHSSWPRFMQDRTNAHPSKGRRKNAEAVPEAGRRILPAHLAADTAIAVLRVSNADRPLREKGVSSRELIG